MARYRDWLWLLAINAAANLTVSVAFHAREAWSDMLAGAWRGFVISTTISALCLIATPYLTAILHCKLRPLLRWSILIAILVAIATVGSVLGVALLTILGHVESWSVFLPTVRGTLRIAILVTLVFGIYTTMTEALRVRLDETTLALRTKERDEAEARRALSEAQLASLESRVNPHFFFNTLNSIAALTREDAVGAERMTTQLASLMRSSLNADSTSLVPLEQEARNVRDYLEIEQVRFGRRLRYDIRIPDDVRMALVPRLALQTLVENSVKYAVSVQPDGCSVAVTARGDKGRICLDVTDDGPGFDVTAIGDGHGLKLLRARLALLYGDGARLAIQSRAGRTTVSMDLPSSTDVT